jgi:hypothetical protein
VRQALAAMGKRVEQLAECRCDRLLVRQTVEHRALTASGIGTPSRHVGRLIPNQYVARRGQIADLAQAPLELNARQSVGCAQTWLQSFSVGLLASICGSVACETRPHPGRSHFGEIPKRLARWPAGRAERCADRLQGGA